MGPPLTVKVGVGVKVEVTKYRHPGVKRLAAGGKVDPNLT